MVVRSCPPAVPAPLIATVFPTSVAAKIGVELVKVVELAMIAPP